MEEMGPGNFYRPIPLGGLRTGYARQFSYKEAFCVFLAGYLVSALKFSVPEAKTDSFGSGWVAQKTRVLFRYRIIQTEPGPPFLIIFTFFN